MIDKPNCVTIRRNTYLVRTQAGFRKALKEYLGDSYSYMKRTLVNWPDVYPTVVCFSNGYQGYETVQCTCLPVNMLKQILEDA